MRRPGPPEEAVAPTLAVVSEIAIVMIVIFRFLFAAAGILAPASAGLFLHLRRYVSESVEARFLFLGECRHAFFPVAAADQRRQRLKTRAPGAA